MDTEQHTFAEKSTALRTSHDAFTSSTFSTASHHRQDSDEPGMDKREEIVDILKRTASSLHSAASCNAPNTFSMVQSSNDPETHKELDRILGSYFYSLNLVNSQSAIVFLLLSCFLLKKESKETEMLRKLYEDHISLLKEKNSELEEKLMRQSGAGSVNTELSLSPSPSQDCSSCEELRERLEVMSTQVSQLQQSYDDVCHINSQWALDYEALSKQIKNATGFHSVSTVSSALSSSSNDSTSMHVSPLMNSSSRCVHCSIYESQLEDRGQEAESLRAQVVGLREDIKDCKERLNQKQQEMACMESEYQILRLQVQEIGDLQLALNMKQEYRKMQRNLQQKTKLYQDAMCEKLDLQKQVEKLRQAFLKCFPIPAPVQGPPTTMSTRPPQSGSYYSFPLHSCRNNIQSTVLDSNPPTPPGLLARGDMRGGIVEKDDQMVPRIKLEQEPTSMERTNPNSYGVMHSRSLDQLDVISRSQHTPHPSHHNHHMTDHVTKTGAGSGSLKSNSLSPGALRSSELVLNSSAENITALRRESLTSNNTNGSYPSQVQRSHSGNYTSHSTASGSYHSSLVPSGSMGSGSRSGNSVTYSNTSVPFGGPTSLSSLGYGSNDSSSMDSHSMSHTHRHTPYASRSRNNMGTSASELESLSHEFSDHQISKAALGRSSSFTRPSSLSLGAKNAGSAAMGPRTHQQQQQFFYCPNCKKSFSCVGQDSFDSWFEHVKGCSS